MCIYIFIDIFQILNFISYHFTLMTTYLLNQIMIYTFIKLYTLVS